MKTLADLKKKKIAFVHDWLTGMRGGENVLEQMIDVLGPRKIFTLVALPENLSDKIKSCEIETSFIQNLPFGKKKHQLWLPFFPMAIENFDFREYDVVVSTSHCVAKGIVANPGTFHWSYLHTPVRYAWDFSKVYQKSAKPRVIMKYMWPLFMHYLRMWDAGTTNRVDSMTCNSLNVAKRIKKYYRREADVIYPPVATERFIKAKNPQRDYYLILSALVPYKRVDLAVEACKRLGKKLIVAGRGGELKRLREMAKGTNIEILGGVDNETVQELYKNARAFLFPGEEDFGITPLEAQASGTGVIAYGAGGALETVVDGKTGVFFQEQTVESVMEAIKAYEARQWSADEMVSHAETFSNEVFKKRFEDHLLASWNAWQEDYR